MTSGIESYIQRFHAAFEATQKKMSQDVLSQMNLGITGPQYYMLYMIQHHGRIKLTQLAEKLEVKPSAITVMIDRLVLANLVTRHHDDKDRRVVLVQLTTTGEEALEKVKRIRNEVTRDYMSDLSKDELDTFINTFEKLAHKTMDSN